MMNFRPILVTALAVMLGACTTETTSRGLSDPAPLALPAAPGQAAAVQQAQTAAPRAEAAFAIRAVEVDVPRSLRVSEANLYMPVADIVWRGDPRGDRYQQVEAIMTAAAREATQGMRKGTPVVLHLKMRRFHALTEKARYVTGGNYAVHFDLSLRDARTGVELMPPRSVNLDIQASGGQKAIEEEARGLTQKVMINAGVVKGLRDQLAILARELGAKPVAALR